MVCHRWYPCFVQNEGTNFQKPTFWYPFTGVRHGERSTKSEKSPKLPAGRLVCVQRGHTVRWYHHLNGKRIYIPKSNRKLAVQLALKRYLQNKKQDITREIAAWEQAPYVKSTKYPNQLRLQTVNGLTVRSKSESIIALCLYTHRIPFHYEERLTIGGIDIYPDFTLRHPQTGETFYWEHVGRPDDSIYRASFLDKLNLYLAHGIIPGKNLILTWETGDHPLSAAEVEQQIQQFLHTTL